MSDKFIDLYDCYIHSAEPRRVFLEKLVKTAGGVAAAAAVLPWLEGTGAEAAIIAPGDKRLVTGTETYQGATGEMTAYVARPRNARGRLPAIVIIHANRGINDHFRDIARRLAVEGYLAIAPDMISPVGGTPKDRDKAREMLRSINRNEISMNLIATAEFAAKHGRSNGKVGCIGFCWGGGKVNDLAVNYAKLKAAVAYYGSQPKKGIEKINAALLLHYAGNDKRINRGVDAYVKALKAAGKAFTIHKYPGTRHAFNEDTRAGRYNKKAATLSWKRTLAHFNKQLR